MEIFKRYSPYFLRIFFLYAYHIVCLVFILKVILIYISHFIQIFQILNIYLTDIQ